jgi:hypothetical protein
MNHIFVSYNPKVQEEQSLALRLQTLGALYGLHISLPDRLGSHALKQATIDRIKKADLYIVFSTRKLERSVEDEIKAALNFKKKIIVIYDKHVGRNLDLKGVEEIEHDRENESSDEFCKNVLEKVQKLQIDNRKKKEDATATAVGAFVLVGLGLLLLGALISDDKE